MGAVIKFDSATQRKRNTEIDAEIAMEEARVAQQQRDHLNRLIDEAYELIDSSNQLLRDTEGARPLIRGTPNWRHTRR